MAVKSSPLYVKEFVNTSKSVTHELHTRDEAPTSANPNGDPSPNLDESNVGDESHSIKNEVRGEPPS